MSDPQGYDPFVNDPHGAVGAYVADALDDDERTVFELHLAGCESCLREVAEFTETAAELAWLTEATPPPSLRASVLWEIATVRPLPPTATADTPASPVSPGWWVSAEAPGSPANRPALASASASASELDPEATIDRRQLDELAVRRQRRTRRILTGLVAAALVMVVALGGWVSVLRSDQQNQQVATQRVNELLTAPDAKVYATTLNGSSVSFVVSKARDQAVFLGDDLPSPGEGKAYQLWMIGSAPVPNALIDRGGDVTQWLDDGPLDGAKQLAVTIEPAGGAKTPSLPPVAGVEL